MILKQTNKEKNIMGCNRKKNREPRKKHKNHTEMPRNTYSYIQEYHKNTKPEIIIYTQRTCKKEKQNKTKHNKQTKALTKYYETRHLQ